MEPQRSAYAGVSWTATLRLHRSFDAVILPLWAPAVSLWPWLMVQNLTPRSAESGAPSLGADGTAHHDSKHYPI